MTKNPFPRKSVVSRDGSSGVPLYTLVTPQVQRVSDLAVEYLEDGLGQVLTIQGPYGSGKSHLINFTIQTVQDAHKTTVNPPRVVQLYQKAISADFVSFYKELIKQIGFELLQELNDRFLGAVALREITGELEKSRQTLLNALPEDQKREIQAEYAAAAEQRAQSLRTDPKLVYQYLDSLVIQPETVYNQSGTEVEIIAGENFKKAFFYLPDVQLGRTAYKWFVTDDLTDNEIARLGVSSRLTNALDAKYALSLLVTLFRHAGIRLLIYFDQVEKLLLATDDKTLDENRGVIQALAEICPRENSFLALAGANDGWDLMRNDFWSRVGPTKVQLGTISPDWARSLIKVYLREEEVYVDRGETEERDIAPFTFAGTDEILKISNGNIRAFLQICHEVYKNYASDGAGTLGIGPKEVNSALVNQFDEASVLAEIQSVLAAKGLRFELQSKLNSSFTADILIGDKANPLAVVDIVNSLFYLDEAENAVGLLNRREALIREYPRTRFIVVSIGYVSDEVTNRLTGAVDGYLVYDGQQFAKSFASVLESLSANGYANQSVVQVNTPEVKEDLQELLAAREREISELNERLQTLAQGPARKSSVRHREWRSWLRNDQQEWEKRQKELATEAEKQRSYIQQDGEANRRSKIIRWTSLFVFGVSVATFVEYWLATTTTVFPTLLSLQLAWLFTIVGFAIVYYWFIYMKFAPLGLQTRDIATYFGDLGQLILRAKTTRISEGRARLCLRNPNPIIRYFGALTFLTRMKETATAPTAPAQPAGATGSIQISSAQAKTPINWTEKAVTENWKPLHLTYLKLTFRTTDLDTIQEMLDLLVEANIDDPRILYLLAMAPFESLLDLNVRGLNTASPTAERVLAHAIFERRLQPFGSWNNSAVAQQPIVSFAQSLVRSGYFNTRLDWLADIFQRQGQFWTAETEAPVTVDLDEDELASMIRAVSPLADSGLASFSDLPNHNFYLRLYRFFSEISWRFDQGDVILKQ